MVTPGGALPPHTNRWIFTHRYTPLAAVRIGRYSRRLANTSCFSTARARQSPLCKVIHLSRYGNGTHSTTHPKQGAPICSNYRIYAPHNDTPHERSVKMFGTCYKDASEHTVTAKTINTLTNIVVACLLDASFSCQHTCNSEP